MPFIPPVISSNELIKGLPINSGIVFSTTAKKTTKPQTFKIVITLFDTASPKNSISFLGFLSGDISTISGFIRLFSIFFFDVIFAYIIPADIAAVICII